MRAPARTLLDPRLPLHARLRDDLARRLAAGEWPPDTALPSETALAAAYGVAVNTLRRALEQLAREGLLERRQGRGTFVRRPALRGSMLRFFRQAEREGGGEIVPESRILHRAVAALPAWAAAGLGVAPGLRGLRLDRVRHWGGAPLLVEEIWLRLPDFARLARRPPEAFGALLYPLYESECARVVARVEDEITVGRADAELAGRLAIAAGEPVVEVGRVAFTADGVAIEARRAWGRADRFRYRATAT
ncbi:GntR family transcriptional regulator [Elioraea sp. Yellowstone]|jgi:GntR family transcriptional regulator|uniref:GntR family transcriptional regulator n=1 Tax=Elioraea sp. Yellowstone TaxID=2592070 RepID=UPI00114F2B3A|nr:GntR family transcriptional regulator [Elioraea sp. Yellowstone]TQF76777.1 GntR family transcriptional regulator [Elioraea sp. Yellowstone]